MLAIAFQHGVSLEALQAANPDVDPRLLSVDMVLVIPVGESGTPQVVPTPTPAPVQLGESLCYPSTEGGVWCFTPAQNKQPQALENLSAWMNLYAPDGEALAGQAAFIPLNLLPSGRTLPLAAYFPPGTGGEKAGPPTNLAGAFVETELLTALAVPPQGGRYLDASIQTEEDEIGAGGKWMTVRGQVSLPPGSPDAGLVWLAAVAYSGEGKIAGVRKWESGRGLAPGASLPFEITVFSLGPAIERVELLVEARP